MDEIITQCAQETDNISSRSHLKELKPDLIKDFLEAIQRHQSQQKNNPQIEPEAEAETPHRKKRKLKAEPKAETQYRTYLFSRAAQDQIKRDVHQKLVNGDNIKPGNWDCIIGNALTL